MINFLPPRARRYIVFGLLCLSAWTIAASGQEQQRLAGAVIETNDLWAAGDENGLYLVQAQSRQDEPGFRIFYRDKFRNYFRASGWYQGRCQSVVALAGRLWIFLEGGGCHSYHLTSPVRSELRLPPGLRCLACTVAGDKLYALAAVEEAVHLPPPGVPAETAPQTDDAHQPPAEAKQQPADANQLPVPQAGTPPNKEQLLFLPSSRLLLVRTTDTDWQLYCRLPLPISGWNQPCISAGDGQVDIFGAATDPNSPPPRPNCVVHCRVTQEHIGPVENLGVCEVTGLTALRVNQQLRLILAGAAAVKTKVAHGPNARQQMQFRLGWPTPPHWFFTEPLAKDSAVMLEADLGEVCFAAFDQNLAAFVQLPDKKVLLGLYSTTGKPVEKFTPAITGETSAVVDLTEFFTNPYLAMGMFLIFVGIVFWRRREAFRQTEPLPDYLILAPLWRRILALIIDACVIFGVFMVVELLLPEHVLAPFQTNDSMTDIINQLKNGDDARMSLVLGVVSLAAYVIWLVYMTLCEWGFAATLGKMALGLIVVGADGRVLTARQVIIRNLLRLVEFRPPIWLFGLTLVIITPYRQRCGDLAAGSVVVCKTLELMQHLRSNRQV